MKQLHLLLTICLLVGIGLSGCGAEEKTTTKSLTAKEQQQKNENKKKLDSFMEDMIKASEKSKASKTLDINSK